MDAPLFTPPATKTLPELLGELETRLSAVEHDIKTCKMLVGHVMDFQDQQAARHAQPSSTSNTNTNKGPETP